MKISMLKLLTFILLIGLPLTVSAEKVQMDVLLANPYLIANKKQKTYLKVGLTGFEIKDQKQRTPVNIAIVLDRSGSMHGEKLKRAKEAANMAINRLDKNDILSIITYDDTVSVIVPATKVSDRWRIRTAINNIESGGATALFAGVSKGAAEVRKFFSRNRVNRIILLSDGLANVGPDTPGALGDLGKSLSKEGISVSTIGLGLGYNEDLMVQLAKKSDGNHAFVENPRDLVKIFNYEFGDVLSVVAQNVTVTITCSVGVKPIRVLGRDAMIVGRNVTVRLNQLYSKQEKYILLELVPAVLGHNKRHPVADVKVRYANMLSKKNDNLSSHVGVRYTNSKSMFDKSINRTVMIAAVMQIAADRNRRAVQLRDQGRINDAKRILRGNAFYLRKESKKYKSKKLSQYGEANKEDSESLDEHSWNARRKGMRENQSKIDMQRSY